MPASIKTTGEIVEAIRFALESRQYDQFVDLFAEDGTYELPFALPSTPQRYTGLKEIRARFTAIASSPTSRLLEIHSVSAVIHPADDPDLAVVEFTAAGTVRSSGAAFRVVSSIAVVRCKAGQVVQYRDYPNTLGIADAAGIMSEFAASLKK